MASGDTLFVLDANSSVKFPGTDPGARVERNGHSTIAFDTTTEETIFFDGLVMPAHYAGGGVTITVAWMAATATTNSVVWETAFERHQDDIDDLDADSFATGQNTGAATAPSVSGELSYDDITHTNGAQMDSVAVGESFRIRFRRKPADANDTMAGDAQMFKVHVKET